MIVQQGKVFAKKWLRYISNGSKFSIKSHFGCNKSSGGALLQKRKTRDNFGAQVTMSELGGKWRRRREDRGGKGGIKGDVG